MKVSWVCVMNITALVLVVAHFSWVTLSLSIPDAEVVYADGGSMSTTIAKLKDHIVDTDAKINNDPVVNLEDYHPINPVPCTKASIKPGPIEHGTPLNPYIPKPSPPPSPSKPEKGG